MTRRTYLKGVLAAVPATLLGGFGCGQVKQAAKCSRCNGTGRCQKCLKETYVFTSCPECSGTHKCGKCMWEGW